jgi:hypothetical protein
MTDNDGQLVAQAALDAIAQAQEQVVDPDATLAGVQVTLMLNTSEGLDVVTRTLEVGESVSGRGVARPTRPSRRASARGRGGRRA